MNKPQKQIEQIVDDLVSRGFPDKTIQDFKTCWQNASLYDDEIDVNVIYMIFWNGITAGQVITEATWDVAREAVQLKKLFGDVKPN